MKATTGTTNKKAAKPASITTATAVGADALPTAKSPSVPSSYVPTKGGIPRGNRPKVAQVQMAQAVAKEVAADASEYETVLGPKAPPPASFSSGLILGLGWSHERAAAETWFDYCRAQEARAWRPVMTIAKVIRPGFTYAVSLDPTVAQKLPELTAFMDAAVPGGRKAAQSRKGGTNAAKKKVAKATATVARAASKLPAASSSVATPPTPPLGGAH